MPDFFCEHSAELSLRPLAAPNTGFRPGQLGALHAVVSHFSVYDEPSIVSLPTGYGKTAVIMALPFVLEARRVLIVEPSDALRRQTAGHFKGLSTLKKISVLSPAASDPKVKGQKGRPTSTEEWEALRANDVVVSTPQSTSPLLSPEAPNDLFDLVIFDEAHHAPADTWKAYLDRFPTARFVFLTATPFRRDKKVIPGRLAYSYPVSRASREKAFGKVTFRAAVVDNDLDEDHVDRAVAQAAVRQLMEDRAKGFDHRLFARAASINAATKLVDVYKAEGAKVSAIDSHVSKKVQDDAEAALLDGSLDGVVCVDMFGEGYDFPKLKIAALHAPHRSLVPTLQFIGRFARTTDSATGDATLLAPLSRLREATTRLFQEGTDIAQLIDDAARAEIADAGGNQKVLEILQTRQQAESDYDAVSPLSLELYAHARIFECSQTPNFDLFAAVIAKRLKLVKQWLSDDGRITLLLTVDHEPPNWATSDVLANVRHDVFLLAYNEASRLCYIGSTRRTNRLYLELMQTTCADHHRPISYETTRRALAGLKNLRFYNLGLRNTALNSQGESYRVLTGPRAELAVSAGDGRAFVQGHFFGSGEDADERETIGASSSSRIWSNQNLTVSEYLDWISMLNARLAGSTAIATSQFDLVQPSRLLRRVPDRMIGGSWNKIVYRDAPKVRVRKAHAGQFTYAQMTDFELGSFSVMDSKLSLEFSIENDDFSVPLLFSPSEGALFRLRDPDWEFEVMSGLDDWTDIASWLVLHPPAFFGADKSSFQGVNAMAAPSTVISKLPDSNIAVIDWSGCAIDVEFDRAKARGLRTVHEHLEQFLRAKPNLEVLLYDHRSGEAADFVAVTTGADGAFKVSLYHCKGAGGEPSGDRVNDVYEVACQLLKSVAYCEASVLERHVEHRINDRRHKKPSRFIVGDFARLREILKDTPPDKIEFEIHGVQPGISKLAIDKHLADLMAFGLEYVYRGAAAKGVWLTSQ